MTIYNFELLNVPFANTATASEIEPFPDYNRGLGIAFSQTDGKPEMKGLNGLFNIITTSVIYLKQRGISEWDSTLEYVAGKSFVIDGDKLYQAKTTNINKQPSLSQNDWFLRASISDIKVSTNGNLKRTENQDGTITLEVPTATDSQRGAVRQSTREEVANKANVNAYVTPRNVSDMFIGGFSSTDNLILPNGLIFQWGIAPSSTVGDQATNNVDVTFKIPFPNACLIAMANSIAVQGGCQTGTFNPTKTGVVVRYANLSGGTKNLQSNWFAIGY